MSSPPAGPPADRSPRRPADHLEIAGEFIPDELNNNLGSAVALGEDRLVFTHFDMSTPGDRRPLWAVRSTDGGTTFERSLIRRGVMPRGFPMLQTACVLTEANGRAGERWRMGGDYSAVSVDEEDRFRPIWADARSGVFQLHSDIVEVPAESAQEGSGGS